MRPMLRSIQELYGNAVAGRLLSCFSRLFTHFLQHHGFTCGINDVLLLAGAEGQRADTLARAELTVMRASAVAAGLTDVAVRTRAQCRFVYCWRNGLFAQHEINMID